MDVLIAQLSGLNIENAPEVVADCVDNGRLPVLIDYITARKALHGMEVDAYVR